MFFTESQQQGMKENIFGKSDKPKGNTPVETIKLNKLDCASVKLLVWLEFTKALPDFINKKDMKFFFQIGKGKYEPVFGIIMIFK